MEFRILGPLEVVDEQGVALELGRPRERALLALLLLHANEVLSGDRIVEDLWPSRPPGTAAKIVQTYVSHLRGALGSASGLLETQAPGYVLRVPAGATDVDRCEALVAQAEGQEPATRSGLLREALTVWRGAPLPELQYEPFAQDEIARLAEWRLGLVEERIAADLDAGHAADLVAELDALVRAHPLRERLRGQHMLALYRARRQADALASYRELRDLLDQQLGLEPGAELRELERSILQQDPSLGAGKDPAQARQMLPSGTVTLMFADVEGSTRLLRTLGPGYAELLARLRELVTGLVEQHAGAVVDWAGDGLFAAFPSARSAVSAAATLQRAMQEERWPGGERVRLRVGLHSGEPDRSPTGYVGLDVHLAARVCAAAHGGQVVVTRACRELAGDAQELGLELRPLGGHMLRDVPDPVRLYGLAGEGLEHDFPPLRTLGGGSLPALHHRLVGRERELASIASSLAEPSTRVVTITGPGGAGKSRLALEVAAAEAARRPVHLVGLAPVAELDYVPATIARVVGASPSAADDVLDVVAEALADTGCLLVLDNLEHLPGVAPIVGWLVGGAPGITVLATSRSPLRLAGERVVAVEPLPLDDAVRLFVELATAAGAPPDGEAIGVVREICRRLDGIPLAIELVAARLRLLPPAALLQALECGDLATLQGPVDLPERQRTLDATFDWSYGLLTPAQRELHGVLATFAGGCALQDAQAVAGDGLFSLADLETLVDGSLVRSHATDDGSARFSMLETVREYALGRLEGSGRLPVTRDRHAHRFLELATDAEPLLAGPEQATWLARLELEHDNLRLAVDRALTRGWIEETLTAVAALDRFWRAHGHVTEARGWLRAGLERADGVPPAIRAKALWTAGHQAVSQSDPGAARPALEQALELARELDDTWLTVLSLCELALAAQQAGDLDRAESHAEEALSIARESGDARTMSAALNTLANVAGERGDFGKVSTLFEECLELRRGLGDPLTVANTANNLGIAAMRHGDLEAARAALHECAERARALGDDMHLASAELALGEIDLAEGLLAAATSRLLQALSLYRELGDVRVQAECLHALAGVAAAEDRVEEAARLWGAADGIRDSLGATLTPEEQAIDTRQRTAARSRLGDGDWERATASGRDADRDALLDEIEALGASVPGE